MTVETAPAGGATPPTALAPPAERPHEGGYRDTVESILIAFILAFIFRAFVVEAFVIPTGSMAPTLLGAHARFTCDDCGYQFNVNFSAGGEDQNIPAQVPHAGFPTSSGGGRGKPVNCPNCAHVVHDPQDPLRTDPVPIHYGDRILVLKYAYLANDPQRWDVVVFKSPDDPSPGTGWYTINFIKRLVGKPGETLMVLDGDVYVSPGGGEGPADFKVQTKPRHVQDALWRIVSDGDYLPRHERWAPWIADGGAGWDIGTAEAPRRVYAFDAVSGAGTLRFDTEANAGRAFTDSLAYAQPPDSGNHNVSDVKLSFLYDRKTGGGPLRMQVSKHGEMFTAELTRGSAKLFRKHGKPANEAGRSEGVGEGVGAGVGAGFGAELGDLVASSENVPALANGPIEVEFTNVDYGVTLRVGGTDVLHTDYLPDVAALREAYALGREMPKPELRIRAENQTAALSHVSVWRDVYYTNGPGPSIRWGKPDDPIKLGADEYFVLGDNTVISKDARYWTEPVNLPAENLDVPPGRVPARFLLGKAFFVYWPAGYRPFGSNGLPGLIPNFGDMRLIR